MMVKIHKININGIRGFNYKELDREPSPRSILINGKHLFVYGENGTGKSSLYDALEWCITGECVEASNRKLHPNEYLKNEYADYSSGTFVEIELDAPHKLRRNLAKKTVASNSIIEPNNSSSIKHDYSDASFIDTNRIDKFVLEAPSNLWKAFANLLNFEELRDFDIKLGRMLKELENKHRYIEDKEYSSLKAKLEGFEEKISWLESSFEKEYGQNWNSKIEELLTLNSNRNKYRKLETDLNYFYEHYSNIQRLEEDVKQLELRKCEISTSISELKLRVIDSAFEYFSTESAIEVCPICQNKSIDSEVIKASLKKIKEQNSKYLELIKSLEDSTINLQQANIGLKDKLKVIKSSFNELDLVQYFVEDDNSFIFSLIENKSTILGLIDQSAHANIDNVEEYFRTKKDEKKVRRDFEKKEAEKKIYEKIISDVSIYKATYSRTYKEKIKLELSKLSNGTVYKTYNEINKSENDELIESIEFNVTKLEETNPQLEFKIKINNEYVDAVKNLSTGHLKCLGFALLIAKFMLKKPKVRTLVIDDPIYAIDHEHRYNLIKYFHELSRSNFQLLIFSSDRLFHDILVNSFDHNSYYSYETKYCLEDGVNYYEKKVNFISKAREHLSCKDIRASSLYCRLALEGTLFEAAKRIKLEIPIDKANNIGMQQLISDYQIESKIISKYANNKDELINIFRLLKDPKCAKVLLGKFSLDAELHHPHDFRDCYTTTEMGEIIGIINDFEDSLRRII